MKTALLEAASGVKSKSMQGVTLDDVQFYFDMKMMIGHDPEDAKEETADYFGLKSSDIEVNKINVLTVDGLEPVGSKDSGEFEDNMAPAPGQESAVPSTPSPQGDSLPPDDEVEPGTQDGSSASDSGATRQGDGGTDSDYDGKGLESVGLREEYAGIYLCGGLAPHEMKHAFRRFTETDLPWKDDNGVEWYMTTKGKWAPRGFRDVKENIFHRVAAKIGSALTKFGNREKTGQPSAINHAAAAVVHAKHASTLDQKATTLGTHKANGVKKLAGVHRQKAAFHAKSALKTAQAIGTKPKKPEWTVKQHVAKRHLGASVGMEEALLDVVSVGMGSYIAYVPHGTYDQALDQFIIDPTTEHAVTWEAEATKLGNRYGAAMKKKIDQDTETEEATMSATVSGFSASNLFANDKKSKLKKAAIDKVFKGGKKETVEAFEETDALTTEEDMEFLRANAEGIDEAAGFIADWEGFALHLFDLLPSNDTVSESKLEDPDISKYVVSRKSIMINNIWWTVTKRDMEAGKLELTTSDWAVKDGHKRESKNVSIADLKNKVNSGKWGVTIPGKGRIGAEQDKSARADMRKKSGIRKAAGTPTAESVNEAKLIVKFDGSSNSKYSAVADKLKEIIPQDKDYEGVIAPFMISRIKLNSKIFQARMDDTPANRKALDKAGLKWISEAVHTAPIPGKQNYKKEPAKEAKHYKFIVWIKLDGKKTKAVHLVATDKEAAIADVKATYGDDIEIDHTQQGAEYNKHGYNAESLTWADYEAKLNECEDNPMDWNAWFNDNIDSWLSLLEHSMIAVNDKPDTVETPGGFKVGQLVTLTSSALKNKKDFMKGPAMITAMKGGSFALNWSYPEDGDYSHLAPSSFARASDLKMYAGPAPKKVKNGWVMAEGDTFAEALFTEWTLPEATKTDPDYEQTDGFTLPDQSLQHANWNARMSEFDKENPDMTETAGAESGNINFEQFCKARGVNSTPLDHGTLSPSGHVSGSSKVAQQKKFDADFAAFSKAQADYQKKVNTGEIKDPTGKFKPIVAAPDATAKKIEALAKKATEFRRLASMGMRPKKHELEAQKIDAEIIALQRGNRTTEGTVAFESVVAGLTGFYEQELRKIHGDLANDEPFDAWRDKHFTPVKESLDESVQGNDTVSIRKLCERHSDYGSGTRGQDFSRPSSTDDGFEPLAKTYTTYIKKGNNYTPSGPVVVKEELDACPYKIHLTPWGVEFERIKHNTDKLVRFKDAATESILEEIDKFWSRKEAFEDLGLMHTRGIMVYGPPGSGKSCGLQHVVEMMISRGDVVFYVNDVRSCREGLKAFRAVEEERKVVVVMEEAEMVANEDERGLLRLLDGDDKINNVLYLATTNHIDRISERILRPGRFDKHILVHQPSEEARLAYFTAKLAKLSEKDTGDLKTLAKKTEGLSFGGMRELIVGAFAMGEPIDDVISRLREPMGEKAKRLYGARNESANPVMPVSIKWMIEEGVWESFRKPAEDDETDPDGSGSGPKGKTTPQALETIVSSLQESAESPDSVQSRLGEHFWSTLGQMYGFDIVSKIREKREGLSIEESVGKEAPDDEFWEALTVLCGTDVIEQVRNDYDNGLLGFPKIVFPAREGSGSGPVAGLNEDEEEIWKKTKAEHTASMKGKKVRKSDYGKRAYTIQQDHEDAVGSALQLGKPVPKKVQAEYPHLVKKYGAPDHSESEWTAPTMTTESKKYKKCSGCSRVCPSGAKKCLKCDGDKFEDSNDADNAPAHDDSMITGDHDTDTLESTGKKCADCGHLCMKSAGMCENCGSDDFNPDNDHDKDDDDAPPIEGGLPGTDADGGESVWTEPSSMTTV